MKLALSFTIGTALLLNASTLISGLGLRNEKHVEKFCDGDSGVELLGKVIKCQHEKIPDVGKINYDCFVKTFEPKEQGLQVMPPTDIEALQKVICDKEAAPKWPLFRTCVMDAEKAIDKVMTKEMVWEAIKECVVGDVEKA